MRISEDGISRSHRGGFRRVRGAGSRGANVMARLLLLAALAMVVWLAGLVPGRAGDVLAGPVWAQVVRVVDGDTIEVRARIWLGQENTTLVRLAGVDAPELRGGCALEKTLAARARGYLSARIEGTEVRLAAIEYGKYAGRVVARVALPGGEDLAAGLIAAGLGRAYDGGGRVAWCDGADGPGETEDELAKPLAAR